MACKSQTMASWGGQPFVLSPAVPGSFEHHQPLLSAGVPVQLLDLCVGHDPHSRPLQLLEGRTGDAAVATHAPNDSEALGSREREEACEGGRPRLAVRPPVVDQPACMSEIPAVLLGLKLMVRHA